MRRLQRARLLAILGLTGAVAVLAACSSPGGDSDPSESTPKIAFLNALTANTYLTATSDAIERVAAELGAEVTEFDAGYDVAKQQQQIQNVIAANQYDGIIIAPVGAEVAIDLTAAADAGLEVVVTGLILGDDLSTAMPQVDGVAFSVLSPPREQGVGLGQLTVEACADKDPCRVVYLYGVKGTPSDNAYIDGFEEAIAENPAIEIVAEGEGNYEGPDRALDVMQNILQSTPEFDVVVGVDQSMQGVQIALEQVDKLSEVAIIGLGGSEAAIAAITSGQWFGGVATVPATEGELAMRAMMQLLGGETPDPVGVNPVTDFPNNGLINRDNVGEFEAQWTG